jgi:hypothetical protein
MAVSIDTAGFARVLGAAVACVAAVVGGGVDAACADACAGECDAATALADRTGAMSAAAGAAAAGGGPPPKSAVAAVSAAAALAVRLSGAATDPEGGVTAGAGGI